MSVSAEGFIVMLTDNMIHIRFTLEFLNIQQFHCRFVLELSYVLFSLNVCHRQLASFQYAEKKHTEIECKITDWNDKRITYTMQVKQNQIKGLK